MVRRRLSPAEIASARGTLDEGKTLTDVVGEVIDDGNPVVLETRRGGRASIARRDIVTAKALPPRPGRRGRPHRAISMRDLEALMVEGWPPLARESLGDWTLRAAGGYTQRANSCLVLGEPDRPVDAALNAVIEWSRSHSIRPLLQVPLPPGFTPEDDPFIAQVRTLGWEARSPTAVMTAAASEVLSVVSARAGSGPAAHASEVAPTQTRPTQRKLHLSGSLDDVWWRLADERMRAHETHARAVLNGSSAQRFVTLLEGDVAVAHGRLALTPGWGGVFAMETHPEHRRRGHATRLLGAMAEASLAEGAGSMYLQVGADNALATRLYEGLGFTVHHTYVYLTPRDRP